MDSCAASSGIHSNSPAPPSDSPAHAARSSSSVSATGTPSGPPAAVASADSSCSRRCGGTRGSAATNTLHSALAERPDASHAGTSDAIAAEDTARECASSETAADTLSTDRTCRRKVGVGRHKAGRSGWGDTKLTRSCRRGVLAGAQQEDELPATRGV
eukprot:352238-Chlamydomonas_euryale.AAC.3